LDYAFALKITKKIWYPHLEIFSLVPKYNM
jgi:hypothetical protein